MDKNTLIGFVLIAAVLFGFTWYNQPSKEQIEAQRTKDSIENVAKQKAEQQRLLAEQEKQAAKLEEEKKDSSALFFKARNGSEKKIVLENEKMAVTFSSKGAVAEKVVIKNFEDNDGNETVTLFDKDTQRLNFTFAAKETNIETSELFFEVKSKTDSTISFVASADSTKQIEIVYTLGKDYLLHCSMSAKGMAGLFAPNMQTVDINWSEKCKQQEKGFSFENRYSTLTYHFNDGGTDYLNETSEKIDETVDEPIDWVAFKNQFFSAVMIAKDGYGTDALLTSKPQQKGSGYLKFYEAKLKTAFDPKGVKPTELEFYFGPNDFRLLQSVEEESSFGKDLQLERLVYLGWPLFRYINRWFTLYVFDFLRSMAIPMGIILILITLLLKAITYPMVKKSYMSSAKMRVLKPKLDEATKQYDKPEDALQKQQAMMQLYSEYGVSPLS